MTKKTNTNRDTFNLANNLYFQLRLMKPSLLFIF